MSPAHVVPDLIHLIILEKEVIFFSVVHQPVRIVDPAFACCKMDFRVICAALQNLFSLADLCCKTVTHPPGNLQFHALPFSYGKRAEKRSRNIGPVFFCNRNFQFHDFSVFIVFFYIEGNRLRLCSRSDRNIQIILLQFYMILICHCLVVPPSTNRTGRSTTLSALPSSISCSRILTPVCAICATGC